MLLFQAIVELGGFLEQIGAEETVDPRAVGERLDFLCGTLCELDPETRRDFVEYVLAEAAMETDEFWKNFLAEFPENFGLADT
jgi:hypothetical protein